MKTLDTITGKEILEAYIEMYDEPIEGKDREHFERVFEFWRERVFREVSARVPMNISLNKTTYLGKKTRALLRVMEMKEPKTLGLLMIELCKITPEQEFAHHS